MHVYAPLCFVRHLEFCKHLRISFAPVVQCRSVFKFKDILKNPVYIIYKKYCLYQFNYIFCVYLVTNNGRESERKQNNMDGQCRSIFWTCGAEIFIGEYIKYIYYLLNLYLFLYVLISFMKTAYWENNLLTISKWRKLYSSRQF